MIYCILGISGSGKTTIAKKIEKTMNIPLLVSYTSRPIRPGEVEGVDYIYVDNKYFDDHFDEFIDIREYTVFDGSIWKYGYKDDGINAKNNDYLLVIDAIGFEYFKQYFCPDYLRAIVVNSPISQLYDRAENRGDNIEEIKRRINDDMIKIENFKKQENHLNVYNYFELDFVLIQVKKIIERGGNACGE